MISHRNNQVLTILNSAQIDSYFTEFVTSDNGFKRKPAPDSINYLLDKYHLDPAKTVMIGDRPLDIEAGKAAGVATIYFDSAVSTTEAPTADHLIHHLTEILE